MRTGIAAHCPQALQQFTPPEALRLSSGAVLADATVGYQTWGTLNAEADNVIWVCHALTGTSDVESWWPALFGPGKALDPQHYFIVCANVLGSCYGSAGPLSHGRGHFPSISIADMVQHQRQLAQHLGICGIAMMLGGSMGGFQALEWVLQSELPIQRLALIACAAAQPAQAIALSTLQNQQIYRDPNFSEGHYDDDCAPEDGLSLARQLGHLSYRCDTELADRFGREQRDDGRFQVQSYLQHQGDKLVRRFDANCYLRLNQALLDYSVHSHEQAVVKLRQFYAPVLIVGVDSDWLYPWHEQIKLADYFPNAALLQVHSASGHDGFLLDAQQFEPALRQLLLSGSAAEGSTGSKPKTHPVQRSSALCV